MKILDKISSKQQKKSDKKQNASSESVKTKKEAVVSKEKKVKAKPGLLAEKVLLKPLVTEKIANLGEQNKYAFLVSRHANKLAIKEAIREMYGVEPVQVNVINLKGKQVRYGRLQGKRKDQKKAIITLKKGDKIEIYQGV